MPDVIEPIARQNESSKLKKNRPLIVIPNIW